MRKIMTISLIALIILTTVATVALAAGQAQVNVYNQQQQLVKSVVFVVGRPEYFVNGQTPGTKMDVSPYVDQGRTFVPIRYLGNALGVDDSHIGWDNGTNTATLTLNGTTAALTVGKAQIKVNGNAQAIDVAPQMKQNRTFLPARYVAEALGYDVQWDAKDNVVLCYPKGTTPPDINKVVQYVQNNPAPVVTPPQPVTDNPPAQTTQPTTGTGGGKVLNGVPIDTSTSGNMGGGPSDGPPILPSKQL